MQGSLGIKADLLAFKATVQKAIDAHISVLRHFFNSCENTSDQ